MVDRERNLTPLEVHNKMARDTFFRGMNPRAYNGLACPKCGCELYDSSPNRMSESLPPQFAVACSNCEYHGLRY